MKALIGAGKELLIDIESGTSIYPDVVNQSIIKATRGLTKKKQKAQTISHANDYGGKIISHILFLNLQYSYMIDLLTLEV